MKQGKLIALLMLLQGACAVFFVFDILATLLGLRATPISWQTRELLEIGAAIGLVLGVILGWIALRRSLNRSRRAEESLRTVRREFRDHLEQQFVSWGLTPAEQDVALFSLQGFSIGEMARLRDSSEGTIKAQSNAIYRKAGVSGRAQLLSLFIEDLLVPEPDIIVNNVCQA